MGDNTEGDKAAGAGRTPNFTPGCTHERQRSTAQAMKGLAGTRPVWPWDCSSWTEVGTGPGPWAPGARGPHRDLGSFTEEASQRKLSLPHKAELRFCSAPTRHQAPRGAFPSDRWSLRQHQMGFSHFTRNLRLREVEIRAQRHTAEPRFESRAALTPVWRDWSAERGRKAACVCVSVCVMVRQCHWGTGAAPTSSGADYVPSSQLHIQQHHKGSWTPAMVGPFTP